MTSGKDVAEPQPNIPTILGNTCKLNISESSEDRPKVESRGDGEDFEYPIMSKNALKKIYENVMFCLFSEKFS